MLSLISHSDILPTIRLPKGFQEKGLVAFCCCEHLWGKKYFKRLCFGYDAWLPSVSSQVRVSTGSSSGLAWSLYTRAALWGTVYGPSATERPLGTIREE